MAAQHNFYRKVYEAVKQVPKGKVATYGQIAGIVSTPRSARAVGWALRALPPENNVPWHRVLNSSGRITIVNPHTTKQEQAQRLKKEGVEVSQDGDGYIVDLKHYLWDND